MKRTTKGADGRLSVQKQYKMLIRLTYLSGAIIDFWVYDWYAELHRDYDENDNVIREYYKDLRWTAVDPNFDALEIRPSRIESIWQIRVVEEKQVDARSAPQSVNR